MTSGFIVSRQDDARLRPGVAAVWRTLRRNVSPCSLVCCQPVSPRWWCGRSTRIGVHSRVVSICYPDAAHSNGITAPGPRIAPRARPG